MALTDAQVRKARAADKPYKLSDSGGLFLHVSTTGFRSWRMKYRFADKEKLLTFGGYPDVSLIEAREMRDAARKQLRDHKDPSVQKAKRRAARFAASELTFEKAARAWHEAQRPRWSAVHADKIIQGFEHDVFKRLGAIPLDEIDAPLILSTLRPVEARGAIEKAHRLRQRISAVFTHAISEGWTKADPAAVVQKALKPMPKSRRLPALNSSAELRALIDAVDQSNADPVTKLASRLLGLTAVRPSIVRFAEWGEIEGIDWEGRRHGPDLAVWHIPAARMKLDKARKDEEAFDHIVPLSHQAVATLRAARRLSSRSHLIFPSVRRSYVAMTDAAMGKLYNGLGYYNRHVPHGWRSAFSTIMNEKAEREERPGDRIVIDLMLAHVPTGTSGSESAYNRAAYTARRRELAQIWADLIMSDALAPESLIDTWH